MERCRITWDAPQPRDGEEPRGLLHLEVAVEASYKLAALYIFTPPAAKSLNRSIYLLGGRAGRTGDVYKGRCVIDRGCVCYVGEVPRHGTTPKMRTQLKLGTNKGNTTVRPRFS